MVRSQGTSAVELKSPGVPSVVHVLDGGSVCLSPRGFGVE